MKTDEQYTKEQIKELEKAKKDKIDIKYLLNPEFSPEKLQFLRKSINKGLDISDYLSNELKTEYLEERKPQSKIKIEGIITECEIQNNKAFIELCNMDKKNNPNYLKVIVPLSSFLTKKYQEIKLNTINNKLAYKQQKPENIKNMYYSITGTVVKNNNINSDIILAYDKNIQKIDKPSKNNNIVDIVGKVIESNVSKYYGMIILNIGNDKDKRLLTVYIDKGKEPKIWNHISSKKINNSTLKVKGKILSVRYQNDNEIINKIHLESTKSLIITNRKALFAEKKETTQKTTQQSL